MARQEIEIPVALETIANTATRTPWRKLGRKKRAEQGAVRFFLDARGKRPALPCRVTLVRCAQRPYDEDDNAQNAFKYVRDTVARWIHGKEERVPRRKNGKVVVDARGRVAMTRPRAPDGRKDGITWRCDFRPIGPKAAEHIVVIIEDEQLVQRGEGAEVDGATR